MEGNQGGWPWSVAKAVALTFPAQGCFSNCLCVAEHVYFHCCGVHCFLGCSFMAGFHHKVTFMYLIIAVSKLSFCPVFSYLSPAWEMLLDLLFLWMIILVNLLDILILLWYCSELSKCYFSPSNAGYYSSDVVCSGLPIFLKFQHHSDTLHQAEYYPCEHFRMLMNFGGGNSLSNHRLHDSLLTCCSSTYSFAFLSNRENKFVLLPLDAYNTEHINVSIILFQTKQHRNI